MGSTNSNGSERGALDARADDIRARNERIVAAIRDIRDDLRAVRGELPPEDFEPWAVREVGMDAATVRDFLAFTDTDDVTALTERVLRYVEQTA